MSKVKFYSDSAKTNQVYPEIDLGENLELGLENYFAITADDGIYGLEFDLWNTSHTSAGTKTGKNAGQTITPGTNTVYETSSYGAAFDSYDCNAFVDSDGVQHITYLKGMPEYGDTEDTIKTYTYNGTTYLQDVFVIKRTYYEKWYNDGTKQYYERSYIPRDGFTPVAHAIRKDGTVSPWFLTAKYVAGLDSQGRRRSLKGLKPARNNSYNNEVTNYHNRGTYYTGGLTSEYKDFLTTFWLKYGTRNTQSVMAGCTSYNFQYALAAAESDVKRVKITTAQAANLVVGSSVSIGNAGSSTNHDRGQAHMHNIADSVVITSIVEDEEDNTYSYVYVDVDDAFSITAPTTTYISTMHWQSGFSDNVLGRDGCPGNLTNGKFPMVLDGIEMMVGGYEVAGNAIMDIVSSTGQREVYVTNDSTKLTTTVATIKSTYNKSSYSMQPTTLNAWNYITAMQLDLANGVAIPTEAGASQSGSSVGYADGLYVDAGTSGQREFLLLGGLAYGATAGLSCLAAHYGLSAAGWYCLARLSINATGGTLA